MKVRQRSEDFEGTQAQQHRGKTEATMGEKKKITAAVAAVMSYLEEEAASIQAAPQEHIEPAARPVPPAPVSLWGISGRQAQMQMRNLMQLKAFHRLG
jgi:hypothetical protein